MKKLILFLSCLLIAVVANAQLKNGAFYYAYTGLASDTAGVGTTTFTKTISVNTDDATYYMAKVKVSDVTAGATGTVALKGRVFPDDAWTTITTTTWAGGGTDTTIVFTGQTNKNFYREFGITVTRTANKLKLTNFKISLKK